jgi:hypothetical protein
MAKKARLYELIKRLIDWYIDIFVRLDTYSFNLRPSHLGYIGPITQSMYEF